MEVAMGNRNKYWESLQVMVPAIPACQRCSLYRNATDIGMTMKVISKLEQARLAMSKWVAALTPHFLQIMYSPRAFPTSPKRKETAYSDVIVILILSAIDPLASPFWSASSGKTRELLGESGLRTVQTLPIVDRAAVQANFDNLDPRELRKRVT